MPLYQADWIFPANSSPIPNGFLEVDDQGRILSLGQQAPSSDQPILKLQGALVPGFINAHCHLELSHLRGRIPSGTGLLPFLRGVVGLREVPAEEIQAAIREADRFMWEEGIQAVGDISNTVDTAKVKSQSPIEYFTFVEVFDFLQGADMAKQVFAKAQQTYEAHEDPKRMVPHAPYTVSPELFALIRDFNPRGGTLSIHNQETPAEDQLFLDKSGDFLDFYRDFGFSLDAFAPFGKTSLAATLPQLDPNRRTLFVHNTLTTEADIDLAEDWSEKVYWATCPRANQYIEQRLPDYEMLFDSGVRVCIGTDSLSSNYSLSILEEMKLIQEACPTIDLRTLVSWATLNGAEALGLDARLGTFSPGKLPGVVLIEGLDGDRLTAQSKARRLH